MAAVRDSVLAINGGSSSVKAFATVKIVRHRVVHGMTRTKPARVTADVLAELHRICEGLGFLGIALHDGCNTKHAAVIGPRAAHVQQALREKLIEHKQYIAAHGEDMPEIRHWRWSL